MKLIFDTDPGDDDIIAILLAFSWPDTQVLAYIASFGNVDVEHTYNNILKLYGVLDKHMKASPEVMDRYQSLKHVSTLIKGADRPIEGPLPGDGAFFHGTDGLGNISTRYPKAIPLPDPASLSHLLKIADTIIPYHKHILDILAEQEDNSVTWIVIGPLSSLATAVRHNPELVKRKVARVSVMGGAIASPGNINPVAEWNIFADAYAAHEVFNHSRELSIFLAPLDITMKHTLKWPGYTKYIDPEFAKADSPNADPLTFFTSAFFRWTKVQTENWDNGEFVLHDPLADWFALSHPIGDKLAKGWKVEPLDIHIERLGEYTRGMCVVDKRTFVAPEPPSCEAYGQGKSTVEIQHTEKTIDGISDNKNTIFVITGTPGSDVFVEALFQHIWGIKTHTSWYRSVAMTLRRVIGMQ